MNYEFLQVLADQAIWAVCGRAAAVVDMSSVPKQTVAVEVMPLVGGHLRLPKVRVSKYVEGAAAAVAGRASVNSANAGTYSNKAVSDSMIREESHPDSQMIQLSESSELAIRHLLQAGYSNTTYLLV